MLGRSSARAPARCWDRDDLLRDDERARSASWHARLQRPPLDLRAHLVNAGPQRGFRQELRASVFSACVLRSRSARPVRRDRRAEVDLLGGLQHSANSAPQGVRVRRILALGHPAGLKYPWPLRGRVSVGQFLLRGRVLHGSEGLGASLRRTQRSRQTPRYPVPADSSERLCRFARTSAAICGMPARIRVSLERFSSGA